MKPLEEIKSLQNLREAMKNYIDAWTIRGKYRGNPRYLEDFERLEMYLREHGEVE